VHSLLSNTAASSLEYLKADKNEQAWDEYLSNISKSGTALARAPTAVSGSMMQDIGLGGYIPCGNSTMGNII